MKEKMQLYYDTLESKNLHEYVEKCNQIKGEDGKPVRGYTLAMVVKALDTFCFLAKEAGLHDPTEVLAHYVSLEKVGKPQLQIQQVVEEPKKVDVPKISEEGMSTLARLMEE